MLIKGLWPSSASPENTEFNLINRPIIVWIPSFWRKPESSVFLDAGSGSGMTKRRYYYETVNIRIYHVNFSQTENKRRNMMKSGTRDEAEGKLHQVKGKIKEIAGKASMNPDLEGEGKEENLDGKVQEKIGKIKKVLEK
jgi:uncharacterized protein YjbJ (UPF0337 family)